LKIQQDNFTALVYDHHCIGSGLKQF